MQARIEAFNGAYRGRRNSIAGTIRIDGTEVPIPEGALDPEYDQATFDRRYECTRNLRALIAP